MFGTITVSDGISMGTEGMKYSLVSREVIADAIETACNGQSMDGVLAVLDRNQVAESGDDDLATKVEALITARNQARADRDWAEADRIRDEIAGLGLAIKDGPEGTTWSRVVE